MEIPLKSHGYCTTNQQKKTLGMDGDHPIDVKSVGQNNLVLAAPHHLRINSGDLPM